MGSESLVHVFLVSFPGQGHVNPLLRLGKRIASKGLLVTFCTPESWGKQMRKSSNITDELAPIGDGYIRFESFDDGWADDEPRRQDLDLYLPQLELVGKELLPRMLKAHADQARPVTCLIITPSSRGSLTWQNPWASLLPCYGCNHVLASQLTITTTTRSFLSLQRMRWKSQFSFPKCPC